MGSFDGQGYTIADVTVDTTASYNGIFATIGAGGLVENLFVKNINISGPSVNGGICGSNDGIIRNCYTTGSITATSSKNGGIAGVQGAGSRIVNCYSEVDIDGQNLGGGLVGEMLTTAAIRNCLATGDVTGTIVYGGFVGRSVANVDSIFNSGWVNHAGNPAVALGEDTGGDQAITYEEATVNAFWAATHNLYDTGSPVWDFDTVPIWYADNDSLPSLLGQQ